MSNKPDIKLIEELIASLPIKYDDKQLQLISQYGYLIGLLAYLASDDFYARTVILKKIKELQQQKK